ncbi:hypothetical protein HRI_003726100 [Hibiscus trionum]|uniref:Endonuclease/exonuclease/phosphatase domain-containing protein n=1 Tax=Hibiscus trionum TaxID=183268 RepID=A0A9W7IV68_HIBTR|nr:hypothetical protein HRI_003726100 [Hibiscus trionum]
MTNKAIFVSWNIMGLGRAEKRVAVRNLVVKSDTKFLFLQESKLRMVDEKLIRKIGGIRRQFDFRFSPAEGAAGGLITCWDPKVFGFERGIIDQNFIALIGKLADKESRCLVINVYGPNDSGERQEFFNQLLQIIKDADLPTVIRGDFNVVRFREEKIGASWNKKAMDSFNEFIDNLEMIDFPMQGESLRGPTSGRSLPLADWTCLSFPWKYNVYGKVCFSFGFQVTSLIIIR